MFKQLLGVCVCARACVCVCEHYSWNNKYDRDKDFPNALTRKIQFFVSYEQENHNITSNSQ